MSCRMTYPRHVLQRVTDRKARKLAIDDSDEITSDHDVNIFTTPDSRVEVVEDSNPIVEGHIDLFGELIPPTKSVSEPVPKTKYVRRTPVSKRKKKPPTEFVTIGPISKPQRTFVPTPKIIKIMKDAQSELYSLMGLNQSASDISTVSNDCLNVSGVQSLLASPTCNAKNKCDENSTSIENSKKSPVFEGVVAFVDYKIDNDRSGDCIIQQLLEMGAKVEKTFNLKVTHVVFRDGYRRTHTKAVERNIPLVSARWLEDCKLANKILNPVDYPPVDIQKYSTPRKFNFNILKNYEYKCLRPSNIERDRHFKSKCDQLMERLNNFQLEYCNKNEESSDIVETPQKIDSSPEQDELDQSNDIIGILSNHLRKILNTNDSPIEDEEINNLYVPMSIKVIRKYLTPQGRENKSLTELDSELLKIEDRLKLDQRARQRFRKLLFPLDKELNDMTTVSDFPSPSPQKLRISAPARLISQKKRKKVLDKEILPLSKNFKNNVNSPQKKNMADILQWRIPTDLRPRKVIKVDIKNKKNLEKSLTQETIPNMFSRNSSMIFQTPKASVASPIELQSITCTGLTKHEVDIIKLSIQNLGTFVFHSKVESSTTYVVTKSQPKRTLNMTYAMAFGCFIISEKWIHNSHEIGRWLPHQEYLIQDLSEPVKAFQIRRQTFGVSLTFHIFDDAGALYIANTCEPSAKDLKRLVRSCGGQCTSIETMANVVVGYTPRMNNNINEKWILDCVSQGTLLDKYQYRLVNNNMI